VGKEQVVKGQLVAEPESCFRVGLGGGWRASKGLKCAVKISVWELAGAGLAASDAAAADTVPATAASAAMATPAKAAFLFAWGSLDSGLALGDSAAGRPGGGVPVLAGYCTPAGLLCRTSGRLPAGTV